MKQEIIRDTKLGLLIKAAYTEKNRHVNYSLNTFCVILQKKQNMSNMQVTKVIKDQHFLEWTAPYCYGDDSLPLLLGAICRALFIVGAWFKEQFQ